MSRAKLTNARRKQRVSAVVAPSGRRPSALVGVSLVEAHLRAGHRRSEGRDAGVGVVAGKANCASLKTGANIDAAKAVGKLIAERAREGGVKEVVFDRGGYIYHGRVKALADAAREGGLNSKGSFMDDPMRAASACAAQVTDEHMARESTAVAAAIVIAKSATANSSTSWSTSIASPRW